MLGAVALVGGMAACSKPAPPAPPPSEVSILTVQPRDVQARFEYIGQASASKSVEVRAQITGVIVERPYVEGTDVKKGTVLFRIDPRTYEASYRSAQAQLVDAQARQANADRNLARLKSLITEHAVAQKDYDDAETASQQARAAVESGAAAVDKAKKDFDDTYVRAEITGRAGRALLVLGARVTGPGDLLTLVEQTDPVYVIFNFPDRDVLRWRRDIAEKRLILPKGLIDVQVTLADGSVSPYKGTISFSDVALQPLTGSLQIRATFPNPTRTLLPGQFVRVGVLGLNRTQAILIPQRAVQQTLGKSFVYVVGDSNKVGTRDIVGADWDGSDWLIDSGLKAGDKVIVDGTQKIGPGAPVRTVAYQPTPEDSTRRRPAPAVAAPSAPPRIRGGMP